MARMGWLFGSSAAVAVALGAAGSACNYDWTYVAPLDGIDASKPSNDPSGTPPLPTDPPVTITGCASEKDCPDREMYCQFKDGMCGRGDRGFCVPRKTCADVAPEPDPAGVACACNGTKVASRCEAALTYGVDVEAKIEGCGAPPPLPTFPCPPTALCAIKSQYCWVSKIKGVSECMPFPSDCAGIGCGCEKLPTGCDCKESADHAEVTLTCP